VRGRVGDEQAPAATTSYMIVREEKSHFNCAMFIGVESFTNLTCCHKIATVLDKLSHSDATRLKYLTHTALPVSSNHNLIKTKYCLRALRKKNKIGKHTSQKPFIETEVVSTNTVG